MLSRLLRLVAIGAVASLVACAQSDEAEEPATGAAESDFTTCGELPRSWMETKRVSAGIAQLGVKLRVGEARPAREPVADILYMHGFADRMDNHKPLFDEWTRRGARVISFEYPSHGETCGVGLSAFRLQNLTQMAEIVERETVEDARRPLIVAGWSTGGLIATRLSQGAGSLSRPISGAMLYAPGVDVQVVLSAVTTESLTSDPSPPHTGPISPTRPALYALFSASLLAEGAAARWSTLPSSIPTLLFTGGDEEDTYADTPGLKRFVTDQRAAGATIDGIACAGGKHELDNEANPIGHEVRTASGEFFADLVSGTRSAPKSRTSCKAF